MDVHAAIFLVMDITGFASASGCIALRDGTDFVLSCKDRRGMADRLNE
jgi:hypothetical protein